MTNKRKWARIIAAGFFVFWLAILYAGADHPPPPGFIVVIIIDLICSVVVYFRAGTYIDWVKSQKKKRFIRALGDGFAAGAMIAILTFIFPGGGEPSIPTPGLLENIIWISILAFVGAINSMIVYGFAAYLTKRMIARHDPFP